MDDEKVKNHKKQALNSMDSYLENLIENYPSKADKLCYWLEDYTKLLRRENDIKKYLQENDNKEYKFRRYDKGDVIKLNLGYNIGSEEGGLHYCVVVDNFDTVHSNTLTVIPLTSLKEGRNVCDLRKGEVFLGTEIKDKTFEKINNLIQDFNNYIDEFNQNANNVDEVKRSKLIKETKLKIKLYTKIKKEFDKMKIGSIALVLQITTVSKLRIKNPITNNDVLSGIKISEDNLNKIDEKLKEYFCKPNK